MLSCSPIKGVEINTSRKTQAEHKTVNIIILQFLKMLRETYIALEGCSSAGKLLRKERQGQV